MKIAASITVCLLVTGSLFGQDLKKMAAQKPRSGNSARKVIFGAIKDERRRPFKGVGAFVYTPDSILLASAITDKEGKYETNGVLPGKYFVKFVYPNKMTSIVYGFTLKDDLEISLYNSPPEADTLISYDAIAPKKDTKAKKS